MARQNWISVVWPAFLMACAMELLVFALVDPVDLNWHGEALRLSRQGVYTAAFFMFWAAAAGAGALTLLLSRPSAQNPSAPISSQED
jgi:NhaP-type Na+/H+ or K+/H+ antiporter